MSKKLDREERIRKLVENVWDDPSKISGYLELYKQVCPTEYRLFIHSMFDDLLETLEEEHNTELYTPEK